MSTFDFWTIAQNTALLSLVYYGLYKYFVLPSTMASALPSAKIMPYSIFLKFVHQRIPPLGFPVTETHVAGAFWGLIALWTATNFYGAELVVNLLAVIYPAWMSYKAEKEMKFPTQWMAYWIIFALLYVIEFFHFFIYYIPIYQTFKLTLLLWCMYPGPSNGAEIIYNSALKPVLGALNDWAGSVKKPIVEFPKDD